MLVGYFDVYVWFDFSFCNGKEVFDCDFFDMCIVIEEVVVKNYNVVGKCFV